MKSHDKHNVYFVKVENEIPEVIKTPMFVRTYTPCKIPLDPLYRIGQPTDLIDLYLIYC